MTVVKLPRPDTPARRWWHLQDDATRACWRLRTAEELPETLAVAAAARGWPEWAEVMAVQAAYEAWRAHRPVTAEELESTDA